MMIIIKVKREKTPILLVLQPSWWDWWGLSFLTSPYGRIPEVQIQMPLDVVNICSQALPPAVIFYPLSPGYVGTFLRLGLSSHVEQTLHSLPKAFSFQSHLVLLSEGWSSRNQSSPSVTFIPLFYKSGLYIIDWCRHMFIYFSADYKVSGSRVYIWLIFLILAWTNRVLACRCFISPGWIEMKG